MGLAHLRLVVGNALELFCEQLVCLGGLFIKTLRTDARITHIDRKRCITNVSRSRSRSAVSGC